VTVLAAVIVTVQVVVVKLSQPAQLVNVEPGSGWAVSVTISPWAKAALHVAPQSIPPPVTLPDPVPLVRTVSACWDVLVNVAVKVRSPLIVTLQVAPLTLSQPVQLAKLEPVAGTAVSVTGVPYGRLAVHAAPQSIDPPAPVTVPAPAPAFTTVSAWPFNANAAATTVSASIVTLQVPPVTVSHPVQPVKVEPVAAVAVRATCAP
jgi:hypothetical protein